MVFILQEFLAVRQMIKEGLAAVMKDHSTFSAPLIAKKCFLAKVRPNEYHFGANGNATTLRELSEKINKDISTLDHFKKAYGDLFHRMKEFLKPEYEAEINKMTEEIDSMIAESVKEIPATPVKAPAVNKKPVGGKNKKQQKEDEDKNEKMDIDVEKIETKKEKVEVKEKEKAAAKPARGKAAKQQKKVTEKEEKVQEPEPEIKDEIDDVKPEVADESERKCGICSKELSSPMYQCIDDHVVCHICLHASERGYCPICRKTGKNRRPKRHENVATLKTSKSDATELKMDVDEPKTEVEVPEKKEANELDVKIKSASEPAVAHTPVVAMEEPQGKGRKRRGKNDVPIEGETKEKTKKVSTPVKQKRLTKAEKKLLEAKANAVAVASAETKIDENVQPPKLEALFAAGAASNLPKSVLLPTAPIVQNLLPKSPQPQVAAVQAFQLRPTTGNLQILASPTGLAAPGSPPQFRMQASSPGHPSIRPQGLQFFKIVEGKPVQIGGSLVTTGDGSAIQPRLPTSPLPIQANAQPKLLYVRNPVPTTSSTTIAPVTTANNLTGAVTATNSPPQPKLFYVRHPVPASTAAPTTTPNNLTTSTRPQLAQKQIILLSKKAPGNAHILTPVSPTNSQGIVKLVSADGNGDGAKVMLGSNVARVAPSQLQGPVLLGPVGTLPSPPLPAPQLPNVPLPRAVLNSNVDKTQALLPKSPLPQAQIKGAPAPVKMTSALPTAPALATTTAPKSDSVVNKAFVWKNSDKTQFKLSARFNFDLFREYQKAHPNKDIRFALASIVTEDKSNEFSFHLSQQKEEGDESGGCYWQLGVRAKNVSEHVWHLKVKVDPPVFLVSNGTFKQTMANFRIPKEVSDKAVVDYELLLMGKASAVAATAASGAQTAAKTGRGAKKAAVISQQQQQQQQQQPQQLQKQP